MARLDPPAVVTATDGQTPVLVAWTPVDSAGVYAVFRSTALGDEGYIIGLTDAQTWNDTTALVGQVYWYGVQARANDGFGCSLLSPQDSGYAYPVAPDVPDPPAILIAVVNP